MTPDLVSRILSATHAHATELIAEVVRAAEREAEAREREACAKVADMWRMNMDAPRDDRAHEWAASARWIAAEIRKRGQP